jgi:hypothetical protein
MNSRLSDLCLQNEMSARRIMIEHTMCCFPERNRALCFAGLQRHIAPLNQTVETMITMQHALQLADRVVVHAKPS